jgi:hypothetical protein
MARAQRGVMKKFVAAIIGLFSVFWFFSSPAFAADCYASGASSKTCVSDTVTTSTSYGSWSNYSEGRYKETSTTINGGTVTTGVSYTCNFKKRTVTTTTTNKRTTTNYSLLQNGTWFLTSTNYSTLSTNVSTSTETVSLGGHPLC